MKSKASYFNISMPLVKENLRRFWAIPALGFLAYFLSGIFPILMSYNHIDDMSGHIHLFLHNEHLLSMGLHLILPIITAVTVFRYIQSESSVTALHTMPFKRTQLFNSNVVSGFILTTAPIFASEIILQLIAKPVYTEQMYVYSGDVPALKETAVDFFQQADVFSWFWQSLLIISVTYAIAVLAGMVTGNTIMHIALAFGFNFLIFAVYLSVATYCEAYLFGFNSAFVHIQPDMLAALSPFVHTLLGTHGRNTSFPLGLQIYYIVLTLVILYISYVLYKKRSLEKAGDYIVFNFMRTFICYLITFFGMSLMGYYFSSLGYSSDYAKDRSELYFYFGLALGAVISFIIARMLVLRTTRIFDKSTLKSFCIYFLLAMIFVSSITLDLTGFEKRVPHADKIDGVYFSGFDTFSQWGGSINGVPLYKSSSKKTKHDMPYFSDPANIEAITAFHKDIVNKENSQNQEGAMNPRFDLNYDTASPFDIQRSYSLSRDQIKASKELKRLYESSECKSYLSINKLNYEKITQISLNNVFYYDEKAQTKLKLTQPHQIDGLLAAMEKDLQSRTYEEYSSPIHPYSTVFIGYEAFDYDNILSDEALDMDILLSDKNTIKWLSDNGLVPYLECTPDMISKIVFTEHNSEIDEKIAMMERAYPQKRTYTNNVETKVSTGLDTAVSGVDKDGRRQLVITDKDRIQEVLNTFASDRINYDNYYEGTIVLNRLNGNNSNITYDAANLPKFMADYFN